MIRPTTLGADNCVAADKPIGPAKKNYYILGQKRGQRILLFETEMFSDPFCRLSPPGFTDKITIVKDAVAGCRQRTQEMIVPLVHPPWPAQVVFCEAIGVIGGVESNRQGQDRHGSACPLGSGTTL